MKMIDGTVFKCIHEALDLDWCDCSDEVRAEFDVKLPKIGEFHD